MKTRFSTYDILCSLTELQKYVGLRVNQVYDVDHKTYLIRLQKTEEKVVILIESGNRIHSTNFEWPKNVAPSSFSMKLRKHLKNKRLESLKQLGVDRIVDMQFGTGEAAYHVILELYDKGNIILTDFELTILNILRPYTDGDKVRYAVREKYPVGKAREDSGPVDEETLRNILSFASPGDNLKKLLNPRLSYGPAIIDHVLLGVGLQGNNKLGNSFDVDKELPRLLTAIAEAENLMKEATTTPARGFIIQKIEKRLKPDGGHEDFRTNQEFHPRLFRQHTAAPYKEYDSFDVAVDEFFSSIEGQKIDMRAIQQEREAMKKLENVRKDHDQRLEQLTKTQEKDRIIAELITMNQQLVDQAILAIRTAIANQMSWTDIQQLVKEAQGRGDDIASHIKHLKLDTNHITMELREPYSDEELEDSEDVDERKKPLLVDIDLDLTAFANARKYYDQKRSAAKKQQKTIESQGKAFKSAEKKTKQALKEMQAIVNINKARKVYWFEKFFWFISSENYLVIAGRDMMQNELIVKRYMRQGDIYVHADIHGASSIVIKNPTGEPVPPKTLNEAGNMAICYSVAWDAKVVTNAWWVHADQVSKTAPAGEYLTAGSFMIRGKKNYLPPCQLVMGFSFLFKVEEGSMWRHAEERKVKLNETEDDALSIKTGEMSVEEDVEVQLSDDGESDNEDVEVVKEEKESDIQGESVKEKIEDSEEDEDDDETDEGDEEEENIEVNDNKEIEFPDTEIKIRHTGRQISLETKSSISTSIADDTNEDEEERVVYLGDTKPVIVKSSKAKRQNQRNKEEKQISDKKKEENENKKNVEENKIKRGHRGKMKKIKKKYKDQDEEERRLCMEILQGAGSAKSNKRNKKKEKNQSKTEKKIPVQKPKPPPILEIREKGSGNESEEEQVELEQTVNTELEMLNSLTGLPHSEDELLFAVPVVAPYSTLLNYKYKVKLTPGTGKRGKAARTAVSMFLKEKLCSQREKELLKGVKDENLSRNLPGKVKVSAPQLYKK